MEDLRQDPAYLLAELTQEHRKVSGKLKIFLGYAAGVGKTYAMLDAAHQTKKLGKDVVIGYIEPHPRPETISLMEGLEQVPTQKINYKGKIFEELDVDAVIERNPEIVLIDELAHTNIPTMRHLKRFGDVEELLAKGIHVYTTVNIQHIESLHNLVEEITGVKVRERIPDYLIDQADQIKVVDIEPDELLQRLQEGKIYHPSQAEKAMKSFFRRQNLVTLREIALRRVADTIYFKKTSIEFKKQKAQIEEHILVGISSSPTNAKVIRSAARLAQALHGKFTALYVQKPTDYDTKTADSERLQQYFKLTEQLGGHVVIVQEDDIALAIANYAQISGVTKLVIGRTAMKKKWWRARSKISERLTEFAPNLSIHIVPDQENEKFYLPQLNTTLTLSWVDIGKMLIVFTAATLLGLFFFSIGVNESNIITIYLLGILILAIWSSGWLMTIISSTMAVLLFNYFFTEPRFSFEAYYKDYPFTFLIMFFSGVITSSLTKRIKKQAIVAVLKSYRTEILLETNRKLQYAKNRDEIIKEGMSQIVKLTESPVQFFEIEGTAIIRTVFSPLMKLTRVENAKIARIFDNKNERGVVDWIIQNQHVAGISTDVFPEASAYYLPVLSSGQVKGVIGIALSKTEPIAAFERNILHAMINDFSFALEKWHLLNLNEQIIREAELEKIRANLLRSISHDLRTPLTSIYGNTDILLSANQQMTEEEKTQLYEEIYRNSRWLVQMVENLLAASKLNDGQLSLEMEVEVVEEIIQEAISHVHLNKSHKINYNVEPEFLLAVMDARLIIQVFINIIDNAIKYTPHGSKIEIIAQEEGDEVTFTIRDNGPGISDELKKKLFKPFTTSKALRSDSGRGLGLGLSLCQTILTLHGGQLTVRDNHPHGAVFQFKLKKGVVTINE